MKSRLSTIVILLDLRSSIEGESGGKEIVDLWRKTICDLLNCVNNSSVDVCEYDELSKQLKMCNVGCSMNGHLINHTMYADDLVLISPSSAGL